MVRTWAVAVAACGLVPVLLSACAHMFVLLMATTFATSSAILNTVTDEDSPVVRFTTALDAVSSVTLVLTCLLALNGAYSMHRILRIVWIVFIVTSSSSYVYIQRALFNTTVVAEDVPNDVSIIAIGVSATLLLATSAYGRVCKARRVIEEDPRNVAIELLLVFGATVLRFEDDIFKYTRFDGAYSLWYACQWVAASATVRVVLTPRAIPA